MSLSHRLYFNRIAPMWDQMVSPENRLKDHLVRFGVQSGEKVLDVGAGTGRLTRILVELTGANGRVMAGDISDQMLKNAAQKISNPSCHFVCADACFLAVQENSFDKVICFSTFPHIVQPVKALQEIYRVLRPGGKLLVLHACCSRKLNAFHASLNDVVCHDNIPRADRLAFLLRQTGFTAIHMDENPQLYWVEGEKPWNDG